MLDRFLPVFQFREVHQIRIAATPEQIHRGLRELTPGEIPLLSLLFWVRTLPARLTGRRVRGFRRDLPFLSQVLTAEGGFILLGEDAGRELVIGTAGQFWRILGGVYPELSDSDDFSGLLDPGFARAVLGFSIDGDGAAAYLVTETRVAVAAPGARRRFALYWALIRPGSGLLRRLWLGAVKRRAERAASS